MDGTCLAVGTVAGEGSFQGGGGTRAEDALQKLAVGGVLRKL